jgi:hypothetical protein
MSASSLPRTIAARLCCYTILAVALVSVAGAGCGSPTTPPPPTTTTTTPTTSTIASTTTTTVPGTTSTTTTSIGVLDARIDIQNAPCIAPSTGPISCTLTGSSSTGGRTPYTFNWRITNFANNQVVTVNNQMSAQPELGCGFLAGVATFNIRAELTVRDSSSPTGTNTDTRDIQVTRAAGACGT